jgi:hypothetical protein
MMSKVRPRDRLNWSAPQRMIVGRSTDGPARGAWRRENMKGVLINKRPGKKSSNGIEFKSIDEQITMGSCPGSTNVKLSLRPSESSILVPAG